jgi:membrane protease YdiL (CAAX protease family)
MSATAEATTRTASVVIPQWSRTRILTTWAAAALPMAVLAWVVAPLVAHASSDPAAFSKALILGLTAGLAWIAVLSFWLVWREQGSLRWSVLREAMWLRAPVSPTTGRRGGRLWWLVLPLTLLFAAEQLTPGIPVPSDRDMGVFLGSHAGHEMLLGSWGWFLVIAVMGVLNTVVGEELFFRGVLLPRMQGAFGRGDWLANGVLFACYHLHVPWMIPSVLMDSFVLAYPARRYRSALLSIAVHSSQTVVILLLTLGVVLGLG